MTLLQVCHSILIKALRICLWRNLTYFIITRATTFHMIHLIMVRTLHLMIFQHIYLIFDGWNICIENLVSLTNIAFEKGGNRNAIRGAKEFS